MFLGFEFMKMRIEISKLIRQDVSVGYDVEFFLAKLLLHLDHVSTKTVFSCQLVRLRKMINLLALVKAFILIKLQALASPKNVPVVGLSLHKTIAF